MNAGRYLIVALLAVFGGVPAVAPAQDKKPGAPAVQPGPAAFEVVKSANLAYHTGKDADPERHRLDVYAPKGKKDFPVLFFVHGGTWRSGNKGLYVALGNSFARAGIGVVIINYRLSPKVTHPAHVEDAAKAFAWTHKHIAEYGGDPGRIVLFGHSAGGHLVALLATDPAFLKAEGCSPKNLRGIVSVSGVYQITHDHPIFNPIFGSNKEVCERASPLWNVSGGHPPFLLAYADNEFEFLDEMALDMNCALARKKCPVTLLKVKDRNHYTIIMRVIMDDDPLRTAIQSFVARYTA